MPESKKAASTERAAKVWIMYRGEERGILASNVKFKKNEPKEVSREMANLLLTNPLFVKCSENGKPEHTMEQRFEQVAKDSEKAEKAENAPLKEGEVLPGAPPQPLKEGQEQIAEVPVEKEHK